MSTLLPLWVQKTQQFQQYSLVNKAVLELAGESLPRIALARNETERKEKLFHQALIFGGAFVLAPLHAWLFAKGISRHLKIDQRLLGISATHLLSLPRLQQGIQALSEKFTTAGKPALRITHSLDESFRQLLIGAKTKLLMFDVMAEGLFFASLGWMTNWFGQRLTGKKQFTGELGVVAPEQLDQLYQKEQHSTRVPEKIKKYATTALAILVPISLSLLLRRSLLQNYNQGALMRFFRNIAPYFDYKGNRALFISNAALGCVAFLSIIGELTAARSHHERREVVTKVIPNVATFFFAEYLWMGLLGALFPKSKHLPNTSSIQKALQQVGPSLQKQAASRSAKLYWLSFLLNTLTLAGVTILNNRFTTRTVRAEAAQLDTIQPILDLDLAFRQFYQATQRYQPSLPH